MLSLERMTNGYGWSDRSDFRVRLTGWKTLLLKNLAYLVAVHWSHHVGLCANENRLYMYASNVQWHNGLRIFWKFVNFGLDRFDSKFDLCEHKIICVIKIELPAQCKLMEKAHEFRSSLISVPYGFWAEQYLVGKLNTCRSTTCHWFNNKL